MKTNRSNTNRNEGSVLLVTMTVLAVAAIVLGSYLLLVQNQTASVSRSQTWNSAIAVTEAGVEEGMALINKGYPNINPTSNNNWTNGVSNDGWSSFATNATSVTRYTSGSNYYITTVTIDTNGCPTVTAVGIVPLNTIPWVFSCAAQPFLADLTVSAGTGTTVGRKVQVQTIRSPLFNAAIITKSNFNMNGNNCTVDSFDSTSVLYSTNGQYSPVPAMRKANGDVATDSAVVGDISIGNGNIWGHVFTGPGTAQSSVQVGSQGSVGDWTWNNTFHHGIESNYWAGNFNTAITDVASPGGVGSGIPAATNGNIILPGGFYTTAIGPTAPLVVTGPTTLWVQGSFSPNGITIASTNNASLVLFVGTTNTSGGDSLSLGGNGTMNQPGLAQNLLFLGLPSLTSVTFSGNAGFVGCIYAPEAALSGNGGGNNTLDTIGSMVVKSVTLNGHWNFHYDESLKNIGAYRGYIAKNWKELKYP